MIHSDEQVAMEEAIVGVWMAFPWCTKSIKIRERQYL